MTIRTEIHKLAELHIRERLARRRVEPIEKMLRELGIEFEAREQATALLLALAKELAIPPGQLRATDRFRDLFRVLKHELPEISDDSWKTAGFHDYVEAFSYDVLNVLEHSQSSRQWSNAINRVSPTPTNEEELIDSFYGMTIGDLLRVMFDPKSTITSAVHSPKAC